MFKNSIEIKFIKQLITIKVLKFDEKLKTSLNK